MRLHPSAKPRVKPQRHYTEPPNVSYTSLNINLPVQRRRLLQATLLERLRHVLTLPIIETNILRLKNNNIPLPLDQQSYEQDTIMAAQERAASQQTYDIYGNIDVTLTRSIFHDHVAKARLNIIRAAGPSGTVEHIIEAIANVSAAVAANQHTGCGFGATRYYATIQYNTAREAAKQEIRAML